jgi:hypothetical protein
MIHNYSRLCWYMSPRQCLELLKGSDPLLIDTKIYRKMEVLEINYAYMTVYKFRHIFIFLRNTQHTS